MKYNPKLNDEVAALPGFADLHPYQAEEDIQGILELMYELGAGAARGHGHAPGQSAAGRRRPGRAHRHPDDQGLPPRPLGLPERDTVIVPDSAHGTNLSSATIGGYQVVEIPSSSRGLVDLDALRANLSERTAAIMLTNPNTLGLFEEDILEISRLVHEAGALCYYDGANLNAIMGKARPGDMGMDVVHLNLHKTFSTPHGGGGPGAGPVAVSRRLEPYLPLPLVLGPEAGGYRLDYDRPRSIGRVKGFYGNVGVLVRAYAYLLRMGGDGLTQASEDAVLNANYLRTRLERLYPLPFDGPSHARVRALGRRPRSGRRPRHRQAHPRLRHARSYRLLPAHRAGGPHDRADRDRGSADARRIRPGHGADTRGTREDPDLVRTAPHSTPVRRPDEGRAARDPILRWSP